MSNVLKVSLLRLSVPIIDTIPWKMASFVGSGRWHKYFTIVEHEEDSHHCVGSASYDLIASFIILTLTMAALLPTILSDDEAEYDVTTKSNSSSKKKRASEKKVKQTKTPKIKVDGDDDGDSSNDEMDGDFEFGGILVSSQQS